MNLADGLVRLCHQLRKVGFLQARDQLFLCLAPDRLDRAIVIESTGAIGGNAFVKLNGAIDRFNDFQKRDILRLPRKRYAPTCTP